MKRLEWAEAETDWTLTIILIILNSRTDVIFRSILRTDTHTCRLTQCNCSSHHEVAMSLSCSRLDIAGAWRYAQQFPCGKTFFLPWGAVQLGMISLPFRWRASGKDADHFHTNVVTKSASRARLISLAELSSVLGQLRGKRSAAQDASAMAKRFHSSTLFP